MSSGFHNDELIHFPYSASVDSPCSNAAMETDSSDDIAYAQTTLKQHSRTGSDGLLIKYTDRPPEKPAENRCVELKGFSLLGFNNFLFFLLLCI